MGRKVTFLVSLLSFTLGLLSLAHAQVIELKFSNYFPVTAAQSKICEDFIKAIEEKSKGKVKFSYFGAGTLLTATKMVDGVIEGISDIGLSHIAYTPGRFPVTDVLNLPLGFPNALVGTRVANDFYRKYKPREWERLHVLALHTCGPKFIFSRKKPVLRLEDFKGLSLRGYGYEAELISALGATPRAIPMPETYDALLKGVVDGATMPLEALKFWRLAEVIKYVTECPEVGKVETFYLIMNAKTWEGLPLEIKKIFEETPFEESLAKMWHEIDSIGKNYGVEKGVSFYNVPKDEVTRWVRAGDTVVEKYVRTMVSSGYQEKDVREWIKFVKERIDYWSKRLR
ncbi:MAG: TRAP transporter substrate-binding protein [Deltaproteobacteria bacterium]|nr:TRAP transporter substrate-binding protein [Deltaproteobacteria bacterium]